MPASTERLDNLCSQPTVGRLGYLPCSQGGSQCPPYQEASLVNMRAIGEGQPYSRRRVVGRHVVKLKEAVRKGEEGESRAGLVDGAKLKLQQRLSYSRDLHLPGHVALPYRVWPQS